MNSMLASGGYPWTVVRLDRRNDYFNTLEQASTKGEIGPFAGFIREEMEHEWPADRSTAS